MNVMALRTQDRTGGDPIKWDVRPLGGSLLKSLASLKQLDVQML